MAKIDKTKIITTLLLIVFVSFAILQYNELRKTKTELVKNTQIEQIKGEFQFVPPAEITRETALDALMAAEKDYNEMLTANTTKFFIKDTILQAKKYFVGSNIGDLARDIAKREDGPKKVYLEKLLLEFQKISENSLLRTDYTEVHKAAQLVAFKKKQAYAILDAITLFQEKENTYKAMNIYTTEANSVFIKAKEAFSEERYSEAAILIVEADSQLDAKLNESKRMQGIIVLGRNFIMTYWQQISVVIIAIIIITPFFFRGTRKRSAKRKINYLLKEEKATLQLIKDAQTECFKKKTITVDTYKIMEQKYRERMAEIKKEVPILEAIARGEKSKMPKEKTKKIKGILQVEEKGQ